MSFRFRKTFKLTKREKIIAVIVGILILLTFVIPPELINKYEMLYLLLIVLPLGFIIATDPERRK